MRFCVFVFSVMNEFTLDEAAKDCEHNELVNTKFY